ncbi:hypothetical protein EK21DRAFT_67807 [Setomelanomma holmii]|uniref:UBA domain-containing protein n=1 Tax=Setomelanomma holmii TaxID=210430 RepID=A0A9P4H912_9PLEO|nr:hypothetical protein EK21DRAFT_67807 [Setomelanomma holmii]
MWKLTRQRQEKTRLLPSLPKRHLQDVALDRPVRSVPLHWPAHYSHCVSESLKRAFAEAHRNLLQSPPIPSAVAAQEEPLSSVSLPEHRDKRRKTSTDLVPRALPSSRTSVIGPVTYGKQPKSVLSSPFPRLVEDGTAKPTELSEPEAAVGSIWDLQGEVREDYDEHEPKILFPEASSTIPNATQTQQRMLEGVTGPKFLGVESEVNEAGSRPPDPSVPWSDLMRFTPVDALENSDPSDQQGMPPSEPGHEQSASQRSRRASSEKSKAKLMSNSEDDLLAIGLPKEQYKLRPSRSRSFKTQLEEPFDYSIQPEKAAKAAKRRKTTTSAAATRSSGVVDVTSTPQKLQTICDMGFTPRSTGRALKQNNGDVTQTVEWLISNGMGEDELAPHNTLKRKSSLKTIDAYTGSNTGLAQAVEQAPSIQTSNSPQKEDSHEHSRAVQSRTYIRAAVETTGISESANPQVAPPTKSPKVRVVIPPRSPNLQSPQKPDPALASSKKAKRRKTTLDLPESTSKIEATSLPESATQKKQGRGRPKKNLENVPATTTVQETASVPPPEQVEEHHAIAQTVEAQHLTTESNNSNDDRPASVTTRTTPTAVGKSNPATPSMTTDHAAKTSSRSPTSKGKVPYRVGLSKRARIAPLLRMMKKK